MLYTGTTDNAASKRLGKRGAFSPRTDAHWDYNAAPAHGKAKHLPP